jgi:hypothetical protein
MANPAIEIRSNNPTSAPSAAGVDMKFELVVIPSRMSTARRNSTGGSGGGSTPTSPLVATTA